MSDEEVSIVSDDSTASLVEAVDMMLKRRKYFREKKRDQRRRAKGQLHERAVLDAEIARLQQCLASKRESFASKDLSLSWQALATVFQEQSKHACATKRDLQQQVATLRWATHEMQRLVQTPRPAWAISSPSLLQYATLCADPTSRALAKQWLAQHMYHNTARAFRDFPTTATPLDDFISVEVDTAGPGMVISEFGQGVFPFPLHTVLAMFKHHMNQVWNYNASNLVQEATGNTIQHRTRTVAGEYINALGALFEEPDRCLLVFRHIQDDDVCPSAGNIQQLKMEWLELRRVSETKTLVRAASSTSQPFTQDGFLGVDDLAKYWHIPLANTHTSNDSDTQNEANWQALANAYIPIHTAVAQKNVERMLAALAHLSVSASPS